MSGHTPEPAPVKIPGKTIFPYTIAEDSAGHSVMILFCGECGREVHRWDPLSFEEKPMNTLRCPSGCHAYLDELQD